jgi:hypothetical protein
MTGIASPETPQGLSIKITQPQRNALITTRIAKWTINGAGKKGKPDVSVGFVRGLFDEHQDQLAPEKD